jgi:hypothetical protein
MEHVFGGRGKAELERGQCNRAVLRKQRNRRRHGQLWRAGLQATALHVDDQPGHVPEGADRELALAKYLGQHILDV